MELFLSEEKAKVIKQYTANATFGENNNNYNRITIKNNNNYNNNYNGITIEKDLKKQSTYPGWCGSVD